MAQYKMSNVEMERYSYFCKIENFILNLVVDRQQEKQKYLINMVVVLTYMLSEIIILVIQYFV